MKPAKLRERLLADIKRQIPGYENMPLEVSSKYLTPAFTDILLPVWCKAVGVGYRVNTNPLPEFMSKTTIIFWELEEQPDIWQDENDNEL